MTNILNERSRFYFLYLWYVALLKCVCVARADDEANRHTLHYIAESNEDGAAAGATVEKK